MASPAACAASDEAAGNCGALPAALRCWWWCSSGPFTGVTGRRLPPRWQPAQDQSHFVQVWRNRPRPLHSRPTRACEGAMQVLWRRDGEVRYLRTGAGHAPHRLLDSHPAGHLDGRYWRAVVMRIDGRGTPRITKAGSGVRGKGARTLARLRSGDGPLSVRVRPSSLKRNCDSRTTSKVKVPGERTREVTLDPGASANTPVRSQGPGSSLPGPDAGHPLQGAGRLATRQSAPS